MIPSGSRTYQGSIPVVALRLPPAIVLKPLRGAHTPSQIETVVFNFVDGTLYLSAKPKDLNSSTIQEWRDFYDYVSTLSVGSKISGVVEKKMPFGLFVNIGSPYIGLIDVGHTSINGGHALPFDNARWPNIGDCIRCNIGYIRFRNRQIGLGWIADRATQ